MKKILIAVFLLIAIPVYAQQPATCEMTAYFSPWDDVIVPIHKVLMEARSSVYCSLYGITNRYLADDLITLSQRGVKVIVGLDKRQAHGRYDLHSELADNGVTVIIKPRVVLEHNKLCVIDGKTVIMGSYNWSSSAQKQDNSDIIIKNCPQMGKVFVDECKRIYSRDNHH